MKKALLAMLFLLFVSGNAWAANCPSFPFTLSEGTTGFATQVMANFNSLLTCANNTLGKFTGPGSATDSNAVCFSGTTGQLGKDCGAAIDGAQWTVFSSPITCSAGTMTSGATSGRYKAIGKTVFFIISLTVTTNGSCATLLNLGVPVAIGNLAAAMATGNKPNNLGNTLTCIGSATFSTIGCVKYDGTYPFTDGTNWIISGTYESN